MSTFKDTLNDKVGVYWVATLEEVYARTCVVWVYHGKCKVCDFFQLSQWTAFASFTFPQRSVNRGGGHFANCRDLNTYPANLSTQKPQPQEYIVIEIRRITQHAVLDHLPRAGFLPHGIDRLAACR